MSAKRARPLRIVSDVFLCIGSPREWDSGDGPDKRRAPSCLLERRVGAGRFDDRRRAFRFRAQPVEHRIAQRIRLDLAQYELLRRNLEALDDRVLVIVVDYRGGTYRARGAF